MRRISAWLEQYLSFDGNIERILVLHAEENSLGGTVTLNMSRRYIGAARDSQFKYFETLYRSFESHFKYFETLSVLRETVSLNILRLYLVLRETVSKNILRLFISAARDSLNIFYFNRCRERQAV
jgi:hypothetical protein